MSSLASYRRLTTVTASPRLTSSSSLSHTLSLLVLLLALATLPTTLYAQCIDCMNGMAMPQCPYPELCGFDTILCSDCSHGKDPKSCTSVDSCRNVTCPARMTPSSSASSSSSAAAASASMDSAALVKQMLSAWTAGSCMDGMPMPGCQDPAACGYLPTPCVGCKLNTTQPGCPDPMACRACTNSSCLAYDSPPCYGCVTGKVRPFCPEPLNCPYTDTAPCIGCMDGMSMPKCPDPVFCGFAAPPADAASCMMMMVFGFSSSVCILFSSWYVTSPVQWLILTLAIIALAFARELVLVYRQHRIRNRRIERFAAQRIRKSSYDNTLSSHAVKDLVKSKSSDVHHANGISESLLEDDQDPVAYSLQVGTGPRESALSRLDGVMFTTHAIDSSYYALSLVLAYVLMLLIMTYNIAVCCIVVLASLIAHFVVTLSFSLLWRSQDAKRRATTEASSIQHCEPPTVCSADETKQPSESCCGGDFFDD